MNIGQTGIDLIKDFEGFRSEPPVQRICPYDRMAQRSASPWTAQRSAKKRARRCCVTLNSSNAACGFARCRSLRAIRCAGFVFFCCGSLSVSTLRKKILRRLRRRSERIPRWVFAAGRRLAGLVRRRRPREVCFYRGSEKRAGVEIRSYTKILVHMYQTDPCVKSSKNPVSH